MRSPQRIEIKRIIDDLGRQAVELQRHRLALIEEIHADPSYEVSMHLLLSFDLIVASSKASGTLRQPRKDIGRIRAT